MGSPSNSIGQWWETGLGGLNSMRKVVLLILGYNKPLDSIAGRIFSEVRRGKSHHLMGDP